MFILLIYCVFSPLQHSISHNIAIYEQNTVISHNSHFHYQRLCPHDDAIKRKLWIALQPFLCSYLCSPSNLFCIMGHDFNSIRTPNERLGSEFHSRRAADFNAFINAANLVEPRMGGRRFTWIGQGGLKLSKLDWFLLSRELLELWPDLSVVAFERCFADHCPILMKVNKLDFGPTPFRFYNQWQQVDGFRPMLLDAWQTSKAMGSAGYVLKEKLEFIKKRIKL